MCLTACACCVEFLPYICLVTIPFFGSFCGIEIILRLSLFIYVYVIISEYIPRVLAYVIPYLNIGILCLVVLYVPVGIVPYPVIWLYDKILWLSDPVLLVIEVVLALNFVMHCSRRAAENIEEDEEEAWKWKLLLTIFSALCYAIMVSLAMAIYKEGTNIHFWMLIIVVFSSLILAAHNMMWMSHEGIVSDVAFTSLCSMVVIYTMREEVNMIHNPLQKPSSWYSIRNVILGMTFLMLIQSTTPNQVLKLGADKTTDQNSLPLFKLAFNIIHTTIDNARVAVEYLKQYISPLFITLLGVRLYSILFLIQRVVKNFGLQSDDDDQDLAEELESPLSPLHSPLIFKCSIIFMITQTTTRLFYQCSGLSMFPVSWSKLIEPIWPQEVLFGRLLQVIVVNAFYIWRLYCADDWQWSDWFSG